MRVARAPRRRAPAWPDRRTRRRCAAARRLGAALSPVRARPRAAGRSAACRSGRGLRERLRRRLEQVGDRGIARDPQGRWRARWRARVRPAPRCPPGRSPARRVRAIGSAEIAHAAEQVGDTLARRGSSRRSARAHQHPVHRGVDLREVGRPEADAHAELGQRVIQHRSARRMERLRARPALWAAARPRCRAVRRRCAAASSSCRR